MEFKGEKTPEQWREDAAWRRGCQSPESCESMSLLWRLVTTRRREEINHYGEK